MPTDVELILHRVHVLTKNQGNYGVAPAFEAAGRLYAIHNPATSRPVYAGTTGNVQTRFGPRIDAAADFGLNNATLNNIRIYVFRVTVDNHARQPNAQGLAGGIDVEHLLIRVHINLGINLRNTNKWGAFTNTTGQRIDLSVVASPALAIPAYLGGAPINVSINNNANY